MLFLCSSRLAYFINIIMFNPLYFASLFHVLEFINIIKIVEDQHFTSVFVGTMKLIIILNAVLAHVEFVRTTTTTTTIRSGHNTWCMPGLFYKIFKSADELERLNIKYNIALVTFFNEKQDLPRFPEFVDILLRSSLSWDYYCLVAQIVMDNQIFCLLRLPLDNKLLRIT
jgi:hypothetical protein